MASIFSCLEVLSYLPQHFIQQDHQFIPALTVCFHSTAKWVSDFAFFTSKLRE
jgi:hypothetical protein